VDLVDIDRVAKVLSSHPQRFLTRHFTVRERADCADHPRRLAARWAAKEAAAKALGTGIGPIRWHEIEVACGPGGDPSLTLSGAAQARAERLGLTRWVVSMSHTNQQAMAVVIAAGGSA
jgi:holo-[acyl-carrier protein] synthase